MTVRTPEDVAAMLDDLWGVAFKLRNVLVGIEIQLSGKDVTAGKMEPPDSVKSGVVPANPAGEAECLSPPPLSGGDFIPGTESKYGEPVQEGTKLRYHAGLCRTCGRPVRMIAKPRVGAEGTYRCWTCIKGAKR